MSLNIGLIVAILCSHLYGQSSPKVSAGGIVRAADYEADIAQGSIFLIFGSGLGPDVLTNVATSALQADLAGTRIDIQTANGVSQAWPLYVSAGQIAAVLPSSIPAGKWNLRVTRGGLQSDPVPISVVVAAPALFSLDQTGNGDSVAQNPTRGRTDSVLNTPSTPVLAGGFVTLWGTGLGAISTSDAIRPPASSISTRAITVEIAGVEVKPVYAGRSPCCFGLDQIVFVVPAYVPACSTGVRVHAGAAFSKTVRIYTAVTAECESRLVSSDPLFLWKRISPATAATGPGTTDHLVEVEWRNSPTSGDALEAVEVGADGSVIRSLNDLRSSVGKVWTTTVRFDRPAAALHTVGIRLRSPARPENGQVFPAGAVSIVGSRTCQQAVDDFVSALDPLDNARLAKLQAPSLPAPNVSAASAKALAGFIRGGRLEQSDPIRCRVDVPVRNLTLALELWRSPLGEWLVTSW